MKSKYVFLLVTSLVVACTKPAQWRYQSSSPTDTCVQACAGKADCTQACPGMVKTNYTYGCKQPDIVKSTAEARILADLDQCTAGEETDGKKTALVVGGIVVVTALTIALLVAIGDDYEPGPGEEF